MAAFILGLAGFLHVRKEYIPPSHTVSFRFWNIAF